MSMTFRQERELKEVINEAVDFEPTVNAAFEWIRNNLDPSDVFSDDVLRTWAQDNGFTEEES